MHKTKDIEGGQVQDTPSNYKPVISVQAYLYRFSLFLAYLMMFKNTFIVLWVVMNYLAT